MAELLEEIAGTLFDARQTDETQVRAAESVRNPESMRDHRIRSRRTGHAIQSYMTRFAPIDSTSGDWVERRKVLDAVYFIAAGQGWKLPTVEQVTELLAPAMGEEHLAERMLEMKDRYIRYSDEDPSEVSLTQDGANLMKMDLELRFVNAGNS